MTWYRSEAVRWKIWAKYRPRLKRASSSAEKEWIRKEMEEEVRRALEAKGLPDPNSLY